MRILCSTATAIALLQNPSGDLSQKETHRLNKLINRLNEDKELNEKKSAAFDFLAKRAGSFPYLFKATDKPFTFEIIPLDLIHKTVAEGKVEEVRRLFAENPQWINVRDKFGKTPLAHAIEAQNEKLSRLEVVQTLLNLDADPNLGDKDNWTPLYRAAVESRLDILNLLLRYDVDVNSCNSTGSTALHRLADRKVYDGVRTLLAHKASPNIVNIIGTPLTYAAKNGFLDMAKILVEEGNADVNLVDDYLALTSLATATNGCYFSLVDYLTEKGAVITPDESLKTALLKTVEDENLEAIAESLSKGEKDCHGRSAIHYLAFLGKIDLLKSSLADMDIPDKLGRTPLHYAIMYGHESIVDWLIEQKANLHSADKEGYFPLEWACQYRREEIVKMLLGKAAESEELGKMLSQKDNFKRSAFLKAAQQGNLPIVQMLVRAGADVKETTPDGRSALDLALSVNAEEVVLFLKQ